MDHTADDSGERSSREARSSAPERAAGSGGRSATDGAQLAPLLTLVARRERRVDRSPADAVRSGLGRPSRNLPEPLTSFVGREQEIAEVRRLLGATRLLTLTGAGGIGKTRLSHEVAASLLKGAPHAPPVELVGPGRAVADSTGPAYRHGVWLVELAAPVDPTQVPQAVAAVLGVREEAERPLMESLTGALRFEQLLLVLDNCEHLIEACAELADTLLRTCQGLSILATSRQPLRVDGETTFQVGSLSLSPRPLPSTAPAAGPEGPLDAVRSTGPTVRSIDLAPASEAVRLFVERARAVSPAFRLTDRNAPAVEQVCRRLDGIPLAIELAAARVPVLNPQQIAARLDDRFRLLTGGSRTALPRYRTLRAMVDWSHARLDEREQVLMRRLAVFAGGWTLEAAEAVCAGEGLASDEVLDVLSGLVAKSLVLTEQHVEEVRYRFLESLREYAVEKLREAGEEPSVQERHRDWFQALAERAEPELGGADSVRWLDRLERDRENLRAALAGCIERGTAGPGLRLAGALTRFWLVRGPYREIRAMLSELLASSGARENAPSIQAARAAALYTAGILAIRQGDCAAAEVYFPEALALRRQLGDRRGLAIAQFSIGHLARFRGAYPHARSRLEEARQTFEELGDRSWQARAHQELGVAAMYQGDFVTARSHLEASLALHEGLDDELGIIGPLNDLGEVALLAGELEQARSLQLRCLELARRADDKERIAMALAALAGLATARGQPERALRLAAAAHALNESTGQRNSRAWNALVERWLEPACTTVTPEAWATAQASGRAMSLDEAIEYALACDTSPADAPHGDAPPPDTSPDEADPFDAPGCDARPSDASARDTGPGSRPLRDGRSLGRPARQMSGPRTRETIGLTERELEVAALVARGLTNRQIADALAISTGTATNHVKRILARLALDTRVQIAAWAIERGLHQPRLA